MIRHGWRYVVRHPKQSLLAGCGVGLGWCLLSLATGIRAGTYAQLLAEFQGLGRYTALLFVKRGEPLPEHQMALMEASFQEGRYMALYETEAEVGYRDQHRSHRILHCSVTGTQSLQPQMLWGRPLDQIDPSLKPVLLGSSLAASLGFDPRNPFLKVGSQWFPVAGILSGWQHGGTQIQNHLDVAHAVLQIHPHVQLQRGLLPLKFGMMTFPDARTFDAGLLQLHRFLSQNPGLTGRIEIRTATTLQAGAERLEQILIQQGTLVGVITLLLGCMGVWISYQLQLHYRQEEFGTLVAMGAGPWFLGRMILSEIWTLVTMAGAVGVLLGLCGGLLLQATQTVAFVFDFGVWFQGGLALGFTVFVAVALPALWIGRRDPMQLLRSNR